MTVHLASTVVLDEVDAEITLLGSLFISPAAMDLFADDIRAEWFSEPFCRYMFESAAALRAEGHKLSPAAIVANMPAELPGLGTRQEFFARVCASGMPASSISGLIATLKDRWARRRLVEYAQSVKDRAVLFDQDPFEVAGDTILDLNTIAATKTAARARSFDASVEELRASHRAPERLRGATTGLLSLDKRLNGYSRGQLYVIAGRPGMGKSAFMCSSLRRTAQSGKGVAIFSLEMTAQEIAARCLSDALDTVNAPMYGSILKGLLGEVGEADLNLAQDSLAGIPMLVDDSPRLTWQEIAGNARKAKAQFEAAGIPLAVICVDHMGLVTPSDRYRGNKVAEAGEISGQARALAKELDCCVILLCQLSREVEKRDDKKPAMSDLRWSGDIEQDAHVVAFVYREAYYLQQKADADPGLVAAARHRLDFIISKNRNGETGEIPLWCSIGHSSVRDE